MIKEFTIKGLASEKIIKIIPIPDNYPMDVSLMNFLTLNEITISSSCGGVGSCKKCLINHSIVSCQITLLKFIENYPAKLIEISYL